MVAPWSNSSLAKLFPFSSFTKGGGRGTPLSHPISIGPGLLPFIYPAPRWLANQMRRLWTNVLRAWRRSSRMSGGAHAAPPLPRHAALGLGLSLPLVTWWGWSSWSWPGFLAPFSSSSTTTSSSSAQPPTYIWGSNAHGLVAPDSPEEEIIKYPTELPLPPGTRLVSVSAALTHAAGVDEQGNLHQWGDTILFPDKEGAGSRSKAVLPRCTLSGRRLSQVVCVEGAVLAFSAAHQRLYIIGVGAADAEELTSTGHPIWTLSLSGGTTANLLQWGERISRIAAGHDHVLLLGDQGSVLSTGLNERANVFGQLGVGPSVVTRRAGDYAQRPERPTMEKFMNVFLGDRTDDGDSSSSSPSRIETTLEEDSVPDATLYTMYTLNRVQVPPAADVACGEHHSLVRTRDGRVFSFGSNEMLQLGLGPYDRSRLIVAWPTEVPSLAGVTDIAAGGHTSYFVVEGPERTQVLAAGAGLYGQLGGGTWTHTLGTPTALVKITGLTYFDEVQGRVRPIRCRYLSAGATHAAAVMRTYRPSANKLPREGMEGGGEGSILEVPHGDDVYVWGGNRYYQLGLGGKHHNLARPSTPVPFPVEAPTDAARLAQQFAAVARMEASLAGTLPSYTSSPSEDGESRLAERMMRLVGPLLMNSAGTVAFTGGQLQLLTNRRTGEPLQRIYCGPTVTIIY